MLWLIDQSCAMHTSNNLLYSSLNGNKLLHSCLPGSTSQNKNDPVGECKHEDTHVRLAAVSITPGNTAATSQRTSVPLNPADKPSSTARLCTRWWVAALAMPYPNIPGVGPTAPAAPISVRRPPSARSFAERFANLGSAIEYGGWW